MRFQLQKSKHTFIACYFGYITQAIVNNFAPLLFITFRNQFNLTIPKITLLTTINFAIQLAVDLLSAGFVDKIGYRICAIFAHLATFFGLCMLGLIPILGGSYVGIVSAIVIYAIGGGLIEVIISPVFEACPSKNKASKMSLLHSFYCWGQVGVVILSTIYFSTIGIDKWQYLAFVFAIFPLGNAVYFCIVPLYPIVKDNKPYSIKQLLTNGIFPIILMLMLCAGASELSMSQWSSAFAESGLKISKTIGDLAGPCLFAALMGTSRVIYSKYAEKIPLNKVIIISATMCTFCYILSSLCSIPILGLIGCALCGLSVGVFWPGTFSIASSALPLGGTAMYALMALAGDTGCCAGPTLVGLFSDVTGGKLENGLLLATIFPILIIVGVVSLNKKTRRNSNE